jgi:hypothetical protein
VAFWHVAIFALYFTWLSPEKSTVRTRMRNTPATTEPITTETEKDNGQEADQHVADDASD